MRPRSLFSLFTLAFLIALTVLLVKPKPAAAQTDDLNIYGFFQTQYTYAAEKSPGMESTGYSTFAVPQVNVFLAKDIGSSFSAFVNAEFLNNFDSEQDWGIFRLGEAWVRYEHSRAFKVKGGMLIPKFNNLNEIKNRTPLLPYAYRPLVYEQSNNMFSNPDYVPQRAYLQAYGSLPLGSVEFDYAAYMGNSEARYIAEPGNTNFRIPGTDTTYSKLFGGRVGLSYENLKVGVSGTLDETNLRQLEFFGSSLPVGLGDVDRYRIGADVSFDIAGFFAEAEYITVLHNMSSEQEAQWDVLSEQSPMAPFLGKDLDQYFYYGMLGYEITDNLNVHTLYNVIQSSRVVGFDEGNAGWSGGIAYRPVFPVLLKANYTRAWSMADGGGFTSNLFMLAASVSF